MRKTRARLLLLSPALLAAAASLQDEGDARARDLAALEEAAARVNEAFGPGPDTARAAELMEEHFAPDMVLYLTTLDAQTVMTRAQLMEFARMAAGEGASVMEVESASWIQGADLAVRRAQERITIGGRTIPIYTTSVFRKGEDGAWRLAHAHHSYHP